MEPQQENLSHNQSLQLIEEMIHKARNSYHESGASALLWGSLIMFCSAVSFANSWWELDWLRPIWVLTFLAVVPQIVISVRESKAQKFKSHTDELMNGIWISFGVCIGLLTYYVNVVQAPSSSFLFLMLYGIPTFATGVGQKFRPMIFGGVFCWAAAVASIYTAQRVDLVLFFLSAFFAWFWPGLLLRSSYLKAKGANV